MQIPSQSSVPLLLTVKDVMHELSLGRSKVEELIRDHGLPVIKFGRSVRIRKKSLEQWLASLENQKIFI